MLEIKNLTEITSNGLCIGCGLCQSVVGKEKIQQYGKIYNVHHFTLKSKDMSLPKDKRLDFNIWYDQESSMIIKVAYSRMGDWEYRLKNFE